MADSKAQTPEQVFAYYGGLTGSIPRAHVSTALRACGATPTEDEVNTKLGNKTALGKAEFDALVTEMSGTAFSKELVADLFSVFDKSGNGTISINELKSHVSEAMATGLITDAELKLMTKGFVTKGQLNYHEFVQSL